MGELEVPEFKAWPKTPRLFRDMIITEKIDGTNSAVHIERVEQWDGLPPQALCDYNGEKYLIVAQSRKRLIDPTDDNFGFAAWVRKNDLALVQTLGVGIHYGEWWGHGIQRGYGQPKGHRQFSLFNVTRYVDVWVPDIGLGVVPILHQGRFDTEVVREELADLATRGSAAAPGFMKPEGIIVYHQAANSVFKATIEDDEMPKGNA